MIAHARADPGRPGPFRLLDGGLGGKTHDQMPHAVVPVDQRGCRSLANETDVRAFVNAARSQAPDIER